MSHDENKASNGQGMLSGWVLAMLGGATFVGRRKLTAAAHEGPLVLDPVYTLHVSVSPGPGGAGMTINHNASPVLFFPSIREMCVPESAIIIEVESLSYSDKKTIANAIEMAEAVSKELRAAQAGIKLSPLMPGNLPPVKR